MTILQKANQKVAALLRPGKRKEGQEYRLTRYLLRREAEGGVLFFNTLTCELLLLTKEEAENALSDDTLRQRGFVVPTDFSERDFAASVRSLHPKTDTANDNETTIRIPSPRSRSYFFSMLRPLFGTALSVAFFMRHFTHQICVISGKLVN